MNRYLDDINYGMGSSKSSSILDETFTGDVNYNTPSCPTRDNKINYDQEKPLRISLLDFILNNIKEIEKFCLLYGLKNIFQLIEC